MKQNKGSPGVDGMTVDELPEYLVEHWEAIREEAGSESSGSQRRSTGSCVGGA